MADERIKSTEWDLEKRCPICESIKNKEIDLEGDQLFDDDAKTKPMFCPGCSHTDIRVFHEIGGVELSRTSTRGDAQPWTHIQSVKCMSCEWKHVTAHQPCLGNPWDETMGFARPLDQTKQQKHAIAWSNEQAVGLRDYDEKYDKDDKLVAKTYKANRKVRIDEAEAGDQKTVTHIPDKKQQESVRRWKNAKKRKQKQE